MRVQFEGCVAEPLLTIRVEVEVWSYLLLRTVLQDALREVTKIYPSLKLRVFVDDITALLMGKDKWHKWQKKVMKRPREEVEKKGPQIVSCYGKD